MRAACIDTGAGLHTLKKPLELNPHAQTEGSLGFGVGFYTAQRAPEQNDGTLSEVVGVDWREKDGELGQETDAIVKGGQRLVSRAQSGREGTGMEVAGRRHGGCFLSGVIAWTKIMWPSLHLGQRPGSGVGSAARVPAGGRAAGGGSGGAWANWV